MPYSIEKFNEIKKTDKYKLQMRLLNKKSYHLMKEKRPDIYMNKLITKQAKNLIKKSIIQIQKHLKIVESKQGKERCDILKQTIIRLGGSVSEPSLI